MSSLDLDFLAGLAHELRTPLGAIGGYAELLELGVHGPVTPPQADGLRRIRNNQQLMVSLIDAFMAYADTVAGGQQATRETIDVAALLHEVRTEFDREITRRAIGISVTPEPGALPAALASGDAARVRTLLHELFIDTLGSMSDGGRIDIALSEEDEGISLLFASSGDPIDSAATEAVFRAFDRDGKGNRVSAARHALSLPHARALARSMGGDLVAEPTARRTLALHLQRVR